ncbi:Conserved_hypothetical protein [Hexamita inflata]|uniref:Uncharacterized protein n=1 Tax=Hexamita inflata TaxID=28002 RepID=A0AA86S1C6_9EUKA|nr:Conserved hypothetical protein [Hexamita inflata]
MLDQRIFDNISSVNSSIYLLNDVLSNRTKQLDTYIAQNISLSIQALKQNSSNLEQYIISNYTQAEYNLQLNTSALDARILNNFTKLQNNLQVNSSNLEQYIISNYSKNDQNLQSNTSELDKRIRDNSSALMTIISNNVSNLELSIISNNTLMNQKLLDTNALLQSNVNQLQAQISSLQYLTYTVNTQLLFINSQSTYDFKLFNISSVTNNISSSSFQNGFVFDQNVENAFIDVQSIGSAFTLFKNQTRFNKMKIQLQTINVQSTGSILTFSDNADIHQMSIIQKELCNTNVQSGVQLSILQTLSTNTQIQDLIINLTFVMSSAGGINLVRSVNGNISIDGYQVYGSYVSTDCVSLVAATVQNSIIAIRHQIITTSLFQVGNQSSYLLSSVINSYATINHIQISTINSTNYIMQIQSTSTNKAQFGGLICSYNDSKITIIDIYYQQNDIWTTSYLYQSGILIGQVISNNILSIFNIQINYQFQCKNFNIFGIVGLTNSVTNMKQCDVKLKAVSENLHYFGCIGLITELSTNIQINQILLFVTISSNNQGGTTSGIVGAQRAENCQVSDINIINSTIFGISIGGLIFGTTSNYGDINNVYIIQSKLEAIASGHSYCGTIIGWISSGSEIIIKNILINTQKLNSSSDLTDPHVGGLVGEQYINTNLTITNVNIANYTVIGIAVFNETNNGTFKTTYNGQLVGITYSQLKVNNIFIQNCDLVSQAQITVFSGIVGYASDKSNVTISNTSSNTINIQSTGKKYVYSSGIIGYTRFITNINNVSISDIIIVCSSANSYCKITLNFVLSDLIKITNSTSTGVNSINDVVQLNCVTFNNLDSITGC